MDKTPVHILTGFLGAGKSTLLNRLLADPAFADTAIIINEFGKIALDHDLVRVGRTQIARTTTGCLCCTAGSDIRSTLHELQGLAEAGEITFDRVIVETTGLADPAPLVNQLIPGGMPAPGLRDHQVTQGFVLAGVIALVDIVTGELSIENHFEAAKQIAFADRLVLTKTDLACDPATICDVDLLRVKLAELNPAAPIADAHETGFDPATLFQPRVYAPASLGDDVAGWLALDAALRETGPATTATADTPVERHGGRIRTFAIIREEPVQQEALRTFLDLLARSAGPRLLRVKGLVQDLDEPERPRVIHVVQHAVHEPAILEAWPSDDRRTRLVFITDGLDTEPVQRFFEAVLDRQSINASDLPRKLARAAADTVWSGTARLARAFTG